jgi:hypothetical protein
MRAPAKPSGSSNNPTARCAARASPRRRQARPHVSGPRGETSGRNARGEATEPRPARPANEKPAEKPAAPRPARAGERRPHRPSSPAPDERARVEGDPRRRVRRLPRPLGAGQFKVLFNGTWALFFERRNEPPEPLGCFKEVSNAKENAQRLHDRGMRESELTAGPGECLLPARGHPRRSAATSRAEGETGGHEAPDAEPAPEPAARQTMTRPPRMLRFATSVRGSARW